MYSTALSIKKIHEIFAKNRLWWKKKEYRALVFVGVTFFVFSIIINHFATGYANSSASSYVSDLLLDNISVVDVDGILNFGALLFGLFVAGYLFIEPKALPLVLKSLALFIFIRAIFITLTHLGPVPTQMALDGNRFLSRLLFGNDFFFSGHAGMPFLLALIFWRQPLVRYVALFFSVVFAVCVILGHFHYSIDVAAAFFIAHSIYYITKRLFTREHEIFA